MATIESKFVDVGFFNPSPGKFPGQYGFGAGAGTLSDTANGSSNTDISGIYSSTDCVTCVWFDGGGSSTAGVQFQTDGSHSNSGWDSMTVGTTTYDRTDASFTSNNTWFWATTTNPFGTTTGADIAVTWDDGTASIVPPVISSVTNNNAANANVTATVNLSSNGSGGTLQYAQTTANSVPSTGWQSSASFTHPRGTTRYYWASQATNTAGAFDDSGAIAVGYLTPDLSVAGTNDTIAFNATSATTTVSNVARGTDTVAVRVNDGSTNLATRTGNGNITFSSSLPSVGNPTTYEFFTKRAVSTGGDGSTFYATNDTFTVTRSVETVSAPTDIAFGADPGTSSATVSIACTASGGSGGTLQVSQDNVNWSSNGTSFTFTRGTAKTIYARRTGQGSTSSSYSEAHTVGYIAKDTKVDLSPTIVTLTHDANSAISISLTNGTPGNEYQLRLGNANISTLLLSGSNTSGTLTIATGSHPTVNNSNTYNLYGRRTDDSGGDDTYVLLDDTVVVTRNSESLSAPTNITFSADPGTFTQTVSITATASGGSGGTLKVSDDGSNWDANGTSYTFTRGTPRTIYARREGAGANSANYTESHTVNILSTDTDITVSPTSTTVAPNANTSVTINISDATQQHTYYVYKQTGTNTFQGLNIDTGTLSGTTGSVTIPNSQLPTAGNSITYKFYGELPTTSGGIGTQQATDGTFTISRTAEDTSPNSFTFTDVSNVALSTTQTSNTITISGLSTGTSVAVSVTGGTYSKNSGSYTSSSGTASNGDTFSVRHTSSSSFSTNTDTTLLIGDTDELFRSTTLAADTTPDSFTFTADTDAPLSASRNSNSITVGGLSTGVSVTVTVGSGGSYQKNGTGSFTSNSGTAVNGDTFIVQHTTSSSYSTDTTTRLTIGGVFDDFVSTTIEEGTTNTGGGGGSSTGSGAHGIEVYGPDGTTVVWGNNVRQSNIVVYELLDLSNGSTESYTCADANDSTKVIVTAAMPSYIAGPVYQQMYGNLTITTSSTGFSVENTNTSTTVTSLPVLVIAARIA